MSMTTMTRCKLKTKPNWKGKVVKMNAQLFFQSLHSFQFFQVQWTPQGLMTPILPLIPRNVKDGEEAYPKSLLTWEKETSGSGCWRKTCHLVYTYSEANGFSRRRNLVFIAQGYDQIPGFDFTENFAPVVSNLTIRTNMLLLLYNPNWIAYIVDVQTAFLYGKMDVNLYMEVLWAYGVSAQSQACNVQQWSRIMIKLHLMVPFIGGKNRLASELMSAL